MTKPNWEKEFEEIIDKYTRENGYFDLVDGFFPLVDFFRQKFQLQIEDIEKIIGDTLSADTPKYHKEVNELYEKIQAYKERNY